MWDSALGELANACTVYPAQVRRVAIVVVNVVVIDDDDCTEAVAGHARDPA